MSVWSHLRRLGRLSSARWSAPVAFLITAVLVLVGAAAGAAGLAPRAADAAPAAALPAGAAVSTSSYTLRKTASSTLVTAGSPVTYTYAITNTRTSYPFFNRLYWTWNRATLAELTDDTCSPVSSPTTGTGWAREPDGDWYIPQGRTATLSCTVPAVTSTVTNTATLSGLRVSDGITIQSTAPPATVTETVTVQAVDAGRPVPFTCQTSTIYIAQGSPTQLSAQIQGSGSSTFTNVGTTSGWKYNATAYNESNDLIYAVSQYLDATHPGGHLLLVDSQGVVYDQGQLDGWTSDADRDVANVGVFADGTYYVANMSVTGSGAIYAVNPTTLTVTPVTLTDNATPAGSMDAGWAITNYTDFAANDFTYAGGYLWGLGNVYPVGGAGATSVNTQYRMTRINVATGEVDVFALSSSMFSDMGMPVPGRLYQFGAAWTYPNGNLGFDWNGGQVYQLRVTNPAATPTFTLVATSDGPSSTNNDGTSCVAPPSDLVMEKESTPTSVKPGAAVSWNLTVTNKGAGNSSGFVIDDTLPAGFSNYATTTPGCTISGGRLQCIEGALAAGSTFTATITANAPTTAGVYSNTAVVTNFDQDPDPSNNTSTTTTNVTNAVVNLAKTAGTVTRNADGTYTARYTITVQNTGTTAGTYGPITDSTRFDAAVTPTGASWTGQSSGSATGGGPYTIGAAGTTIAANATHTYALAITLSAPTGSVTACAGPGTGLYNSVYLPTGQEQGATTDNAACDSPIPGISVAKSASVSSVAGTGPVTYTYTVRNTGLEALKTVMLSDDKCPNPTLASGDANGNGLLEVTETWTYSCTQTLTYSGTPPTPQTVTNTATATGTGNVSGTAVRSTAQATVTVNPAPAALNVTKGPGTVGSLNSSTGEYTVTYAVTVRNDGGTATTYGPLTDTPGFASNLQIVGARWSGQTTGSAPGAGDYALNPSTSTSIGPGDTHTYAVAITFTFRNTSPASACTGTAGAGLYNAVSVPQGETVTTDNSACVAPPPPPTTGIDLTKQASTPADTNGDGVIGPGDTITYSFLVANTGTVTLTNVQVTDPRFPAPGYVIGCLSRTIAPGASTSCGVVDAATGAAAPHVLTQADIDSGAVENTATATGTPPTPLAPPTDTSTTTVNVAPTPAISLDKVASPLADANGDGVVGDTGDTITYTFVVTNTGNTTLNAIALTDPALTAAGITISCPATTLPAVDDPSTAVREDRMTCTASAPYVITTADSQAGAVVNHADARGTDPKGTVVTDPGDTSTPVASPAAVTMTKDPGTTSAVNPATGTASVTYTITVRNTGGTPTTYDLTDRPAFDPNYVPSRASWTGTTAGSATGTGPWTLASGTAIGAGATHSYTITVVYTVRSLDAAGTTCTGTTSGRGLYNVATLDGTVADPACVNPPAPLTSRITLAKSVSGWADLNGNGLTDAGDRLTYSFVVTNPGSTTLTGITLTDTRVGTVSCPSTSLAADGTMTCTATYVVTAADEASGAVHNDASVTGTAPDGAPLTATSSADRTLQSAGITLVKRAGTITDANGSGRQDAGDAIAYTFDVTNTGTTTLTPVTITDTRLGLTGAPCAPTLAPAATVTCSTTATYTLTQSDVTAGSVTNSAVAGGTPTGPNGPGKPVTDDDTTTVDISRVAALTLDKQASSISDTSAPAGASAGDTITYTFVVTNTGTVPLSPVTITDDLLGAPFTCANTAATPLAPGASVRCDRTYALTQQDVDDLRVVNHAQADGTPPAGVTPPAPATDTTTTAMTAVGGIELTKSAQTGLAGDSGDVKDVDGNGVDAGDVITYTFTVRNTSNVTLTDVVIEDPKLGLTAADCVASLAPGQSATCSTTASHVLTQADIDAEAYQNTATATGTEPGGTTVSDDDTHTSSYDLTPTGTLTKSHLDGYTDVDGDGQLDEADTVLYQFTVTNTSALDLLDVTITDTKLGLTRMFCAARIAPFSSATCTATTPYSVTQADLDLGRIDNTATMNGHGPQGTPVSATDDDTYPITATTRIDLTKGGVLDAGSAVGDTVSYRFTVENTGSATLSRITVTDTRVGWTDHECGTGPMAPGDIVTCDAPGGYRLTQADIDAGRVLNTATATGTPVNTALPRPVDSADGTVPLAATNALTLTKTASAIEDLDGNGADAGDRVTYTFVVENTGQQTLTAVTITDPRLGLTGWECLPSLAPGTSSPCTATATYTLAAADIDAGLVHNDAVATGVAPNGDRPTGADSADVPVSQVAQIDLTKAVTSVDGTPYSNGAPAPTRGSVVTYTFTVHNTSNVTLTDVSLSDDRLGLDGVTCEKTTLVADETVTCTRTYTLTQPDVDRGAVVNRATTTGRTPAGQSVTDTDTATITPTRTPGIHLEKDFVGIDKGADGIYSVGDIATYRFTVTNTGDVTLGDVYIDDARLQVSHQFCFAGPLAPGASNSCEMYFPLEQYDIDEGVVNNTAYASALPLGGTSVVVDDDTATATGENTNRIELTKTGSAVADSNGDGRPSPGDTISYSFTVKNVGSQTLTAFRITDPRLAVDFECAAGPVAPGEQVTCESPKTYALTAADIDAGKVDNTATATATAPVPADPTKNFDPPPVTDDESVPVATVAGISIVKDLQAVTDRHATDPANLEGPSAGDLVTYRFTVTNTSNVTLTNVTVTDPKLQLAGVVCGVGTLAAGESTSCTSPAYALTQADVDARRLDNTATATGTPPTGPAVTASDPETVTYAPVPGISIVKRHTAFTDTDGDAKVDAGGTITYAFDITNTGAKTLTDVRINDTRLGISGHQCAATLAVGETITCTWATPYPVTQADLNSGAVVNTVDVVATTPSGAHVTDDASDRVPTDSAADFTFEKTASGWANTDGSTVGGTPTATPGDQITYTFAVHNSGTVDLRDIRITDARIGLSGYLCVAGTLSPGRDGSCSVVYAIRQSDLDARPPVVHNIATASAQPPAGIAPPPDRTGTVDTPLDVVPALSLDKTATLNDLPDAAAGNGVADVGETITYTFVVRNTGSTTLTGVHVDDPMLSGAGIPITCPTTTLGGGARTTCTATYPVTQADIDRGTIRNVATATGANPDGSTTTSPPDDTTTPTPTSAPALTLDKRLATIDTVEVSDPDQPVRAGQVLGYAFDVVNTGNVTLHGLRIADTLTAPAAPALSVSCPETTLAPKGRVTCTATYEVTAADADAGSVHNVATATGTTPDRVDSSGTPVPGAPVTTPSDEVTVQVAQTPGLSMVKSAVLGDGDGDGKADAGESVVFSFVVTNTGTVSMSGIRIGDPMLAAAGVAVSCPVATLAAGGSTTCTSGPYVVSRADVDAGAVYNVATAQGTPPGGTPTTTPQSGTQTPTDSRADWSLTKSAGTPVDANRSGRVDAGDTVVFTLVVTNTGTVSLSGVRVSDPMLAAAGVAVACPSAPLVAGASMTCTSGPYALTQADIDAGLVVNTATASATAPSPTRPAPVGSWTPTGTPTITSPTVPPASATATATAPLAPSGRLALDKRLTRINGAAAPVDPVVLEGDTLTYELVVTNTGAVTLVGVTVEDPKAGVVTCPQTSLDVGASMTCTAAPYTVTAADAAAGSLTNTATATGRTPGGAPVPPTSDTTDTPARPAATIDLVKTGTHVDADGDGVVQAGEKVTYTFIVHNTSRVPLTAVTVSDPMLTAVGDAIGCPTTVLAADEQMTCTATYTVTAADAAAGTIRNTATATGTTPTGGRVTDTDRAVVPAPDPGLRLAKSAALTTDTGTTGSADLGDVITYTFTVTNIGNVTLTGIAVVDPALAGWGATASCDSTSLATGAQTTCTAAVTVTAAMIEQAASTNGFVHNVAHAVGTTPPTTNPDGTTTPGTTVPSGDDPADVPVTPAPPTQPDPRLEMTKSAALSTDAGTPGRADLGDVITYSFVVTNTGTVSLGAIAVDDPMLTGLDVRVTCPSAVLVARQAMTCTADVPVTSAVLALAASGTIHNVATATGTWDDPRTPGPDRVTTPPAPADVPVAPTTPVTPTTPEPGLTIVKRASLTTDAGAPGTAEAGDVITYTFVVTNTGTVRLGEVFVDDATLTAMGASVVCPATALAPGESTTCTSSPVSVTETMVAAARATGARIHNVAVAVGRWDDPRTPATETTPHRSPQDEADVPVQPGPVVPTTPVTSETPVVPVVPVLPPPAAVPPLVTSYPMPPAAAVPPSAVIVPAPGSGPGLAYTGADVLRTLEVAVALLVAGLGVLAVSRRRDGDR